MTDRSIIITLRMPGLWILSYYTAVKPKISFPPDLDNTPFPDINTRVKTLLPKEQAQKNGGMNGYRNSEVV